MIEIKLKKRYPHSREEDITDAFMRGYQQGKEDERRWWSNHCANCKDAEQTEPNCSEIPNNSKDEPQCEKCKHFREEAEMYTHQCEFYFMECKFEPKDEPQSKRSGR